MISVEKYKAGRWEKGFHYQYFVPAPINDKWVWEDNAINLLLEKAAIKLGELNSFARLVPNIDLFIQLHVTKEAVVSSRIEGTQTNINEALLPEAEIEPERKNDWREVNNYIIALNTAIKELAHLPLSSRLIKKTHQLLLQSVRGEQKIPGEFRSSQNWIGGNSIADASFIPPSHIYINELMSDLELFLHNEYLYVPDLIRIAIAHYQFETIHPFLDGNGRIGRLMITLFLVDKGILEQPLLYLSSYFEQNRGLYYDNLTFVRTKNDMKQWLKYFLVGIEQTATQAVKTLSTILHLKEELEHQIRHNFGKRSHNASKLLLHLFKHPFVNIDDVTKLCNITYKAANDLVTMMVDKQILQEATGQSRNRIFVFQRYLDTFEHNK